jgi:hypothetical protein
MFVPTRRSTSEADVIIGSIALSAVIWSVASIAIVVVSALGSVIGSIGHLWPQLDLFNLWIVPTLQAHEFGPKSVLPGILLSGVRFAAGIAWAGLVSSDSGRLYRRNLAFWRFRLRVDPNPRVWSWFLQVPTTGRLFRVTLKSGKVIVGQVAEYSVNPNDDLQELVMRVYGVAPDAGTDLQAAIDSQGVLVSRQDIELIEELERNLASEEAQKPEESTEQAER